MTTTLKRIVFHLKTALRPYHQDLEDYITGTISVDLKAKTEKLVSEKLANASLTEKEKSMIVETVKGNYSAQEYTERLADVRDLFLSRLDNEIWLPFQNEVGKHRWRLALLSGSEYMNVLAKIEMLGTIWRAASSHTAVLIIRDYTREIQYAQDQWNQALKEIAPTTPIIEE